MKCPWNALADHCDSSHGSCHDWQPLLPAKSPAALNQAGITAFSLPACRHRSNSAQSASSAPQGHTQKTPTNIKHPLPTCTHTHTHAHAERRSRWQSRRDPCRTDESPLTASTSCTDKTPALHQLPWGSRRQQMSWRELKSSHFAESVAVLQPPPPTGWGDNEILSCNVNALRLWIKECDISQTQDLFFFVCVFLCCTFSLEYTKKKNTLQQLHLCVDLPTKLSAD